MLAPDASNWPTKERFCWTKSPKSSSLCKPNCSGYCKSDPSNASAQPDDAGRRTRASHHEPRSAGRSRRRPVPRRSILSIERRAFDRAAACAIAAKTCPSWLPTFLDKPPQRLHKEPCTLLRDAQELLLEYQWPGNVRELENIVTRASVLATGPAIGADELRPWLIQAGETRSTGTDSSESMGLRLEDMERKMIEATLDRFAGHRAKTAEALGIGLRTLSGKLKGYGYAPCAKSMAKAA